MTQNQNQKAEPQAEAEMREYSCTDGYGYTVEIEAATPREAAELYVDDGEWDRVTTVWTDVRVTPVAEDGTLIEDESDRITVTLRPDEPAECSGYWESPYELLGGCRENPGVRGHGGGVVITEVDPETGWYRVTDTWAQRSDTGEQGLRSVEYREPDEASLAWVGSQRSEGGAS